MLPSPTTTIKPRPARIPLDQMAVDCIPAELKARPKWVLWSWSWKEKSGKWDKPPRQPDGRMAESNDPSTWVTFDAALAAYQTGKFDGIGYVFTADDPFTGIDLDGCINADGVMSPWAQEILDAFLTYFELSPSQTGGKGLIRGTLPKGCSKAKNLDVPAVCDKAPGIEVYDRGRYFTITGLPCGELRPIADCQSQLDALLERYGFIKTPKSAPPKVESNGHTKMFTGQSSGGPADAVEIAEALRFISNSGEGQHYNDWLSIGMCLHDWSTTEGYNLWLDWSKQSNKHDDDTCRAKWASFTVGKGLTIGTVFYFAELGGWANPNKRPTSPPPSGSPHSDPNLTDTGNALRFAAMHRDRARYVPAWSSWLTWDESHWQCDDKCAADQLAKAVVRELYQAARREAADLVAMLKPSSEDDDDDDE